jgi:hypothetical protein
VRLGMPKLEKAIRTRIREELRSSDVLWTEYRRMRKLAPGVKASDVLLFLVPFGVVFWLLGGDPDKILLGLAFYVTASVFLRCQSLGTNLYRSSILGIFVTLPIQDEEIFLFLWQKWFLSSFWIFYVSLIAYGYLGLVRDHSWQLIPIVVWAGMLQWLTVAALAMFLARYLPRPKLFGQLGVALDAMIIVTAFLPPEYVRRCSKFLMVVPAGWVTYDFQGSFQNYPKALALLLLAAALVAASIVVAVSRFRSVYSTGKTTTSLRSTTDVSEDFLELVDKQALRERLASNEAWGAVRATASIATGQFLAAPEWAGQGWIEHLAGKLLRPGERDLAEFMLGGKPGRWTDRWRIAGVVSAAGIVATLLVPIVPGGFWPFIPVIIASLIAAPVLGGARPGFGSRFCAGYWIPIHSTFPLGYREISRVVLKTNALRLAAWLPLLVGYAIALGWRLTNDACAGVVLATKVFALVVALQPAILLVRFSKGTRDKNVGLKRILFLLLLAVCVTILLAAIVANFVPGQLTTVLGLASVTLISVFCWIAYGIFYTRGRVDLVRTRAS